MPEGFASVADMRVIVDANADKFHSGVKGILQALGELDQNGNKTLTGLDQMMLAVGDKALGFASKMPKAVQAALVMFDQLRQQGRSVAQALGAAEEYDSLTASLGNLGLTVKDTAATGFAMLASEAYATGAAMLGLKADTAQTSESTDDFAKRVLRAATDAVDDYAVAIRTLTGDIKKTPAELDKAAESLERNEKRFRSFAENYKNWGFGSLLPKGAISNQFSKIADWFAGEQQKAEEALDKGLRDGQWNPKTVRHGKEIVELLGRENAALERRVETMRMSAAAAAEYNYIQDKLAAASRASGTSRVDDAAYSAILREGARIRENTQALEDYTKAKQAAEKARQDAAREEQRNEQLAAQRARSRAQIFANADREIQSLRSRAEAVGLNARQTAELLEYERLIQQLRALGGPETPEEERRAREKAFERGLIVEQQEQIAKLGEIGQTVAGELSSAFARWTQGAKLDVKDMVASILADLAQLTLRRSVLEPLFGGGSGGGAGLFGDLMASVFGGFRADGGDVETGRAYVVGERGPEWFMPREPGSILPNGTAPAGRAGGEVHVYVHGTPEFEARVVSTAEGVVAQRAPAIVGQAVEATQAVRDAYGMDGPWR